MEAHYRAFNGKLVIKVEGSTIKDLFEQIGPVAEVLDGDDACGKCNSPHIYPRAREAKGFTYYELVCSDCSAKLSFGQHKDGGNLWAKRTDENGRALDYRGWKIYQAIEAPKQSSAAPCPAQPNSPRPATEDPRLAGVMERCAKEGAAQVLGELVSALEGYTTPTNADQVWGEAVRKHGDPFAKIAALRAVATALLAALVEEESKRKGAA